MNFFYFSEFPSFFKKKAPFCKLLRASYPVEKYCKDRGCLGSAVYSAFFHVTSLRLYSH